MALRIKVRRGRRNLTDSGSNLISLIKIVPGGGKIVHSRLPCDEGDIIVATNVLLLRQPCRECAQYHLQALQRRRR